MSYAIFMKCGLNNQNAAVVVAQQVDTKILQFSDFSLASTIIISAMTLAKDIKHLNYNFPLWPLNGCGSGGFALFYFIWHLLQ